MPACSRWRYPASKCRPTSTANSGCISTSTIRRVSSRPRTCCRATCPPIAFAAGSCSSAPRRSVCSTSRRRRSRRRCPGVEVHAQILESVLTKSLLVHPNYAIGAELTIAVLIGLAIIVAAPMLSATVVVVLGAGIDRRTDRAVALFVRRAQPADRFHLPVDFELADLFGADFRQLFPRAEAAPADPLRFRLLPVAAHGRAAGPLAGEARARRRRAAHDHPVQRRARLHHHLGALQGRSAGPDPADEPFPHAADQRHHRAQGHHRQIYRRRHHGVLERSDRRRRSRKPMPAMRRWKCRRAPRRSMSSSSARPRPMAGPICRCASASDSIPGHAWSAIWDRISASTIRCSATPSTLLRGSKRGPRTIACLW